MPHAVHCIYYVCRVMNGPVASTLVLLGELDKCAPGTKVRFLGW